MRHHVAERKLGRKSAHRKAMLANLAISLILKDRIETTLPKAKELKPFAEKLVTLGKKGTVHAQRHAVSMIRSKGAVHRLFDELAHRFENRHGGYTRILKLGWRHGDSAPMAAIEYLAGEQKVGEPLKKEEKAKKTKQAEEKKAKQKAEVAAVEGKKKQPPGRLARVMKKVTKRASPVHKATRSGD